MNQGLTCRQLIEFLMAYLDGDLQAAQRTVFDAHLASCPPCWNYLETYRATVHLGRQAFVCEGDELPEDVPESLVAAVLAARRQGKRQA